MPEAAWNGPALLVPMTIEVLTLTHAQQEGGTWSAQPPNYGVLKLYEPAEAGPFTDHVPTIHGNQAFTGAVLHWALPDGLTRGAQPPGGGEVEYVATPNRWLVVRKAPVAGAWAYEAWMVAADYSTVYRSELETGAQVPGTSFPNAAGDSGIQLGKAWPVAQWPGEAAVQKHALTPPLTAIGPGQATFAASAPNVLDIFAFADTLTGIESGPLSYSVYGWYASPAVDPLSVGWKTVKEWERVMRACRWSVGTHADVATATTAAQDWATAKGLTFDPKDPRMRVPGRTLCHGLVFDVAWEGAHGDIVSAVPPIDPTEAGYVKPRIAIGHRTADALATLMTADEPPDRAPKLARILEAFQDDALPLLDASDAQAQLDVRTQKGWFSTAAGGISWSVANPRRPHEPAGEVAAPPLTPTQEALLTALNLAQRDVDRCTELLAQLQWQVFALWWKQQRLPFDPPDNADAVSKAIAKACTRVEAATAEQLAALPVLRQRRDGAVVQLVEVLGHLVLESASRPPYYRPSDPVLLVTGAHRSYKHGEDGRFTGDGTLFCRFTGQTVTGIDVQGTIIDRTKVSVPSWSCPDLPLEVPDLDCECFFLDLASAPAIATAAAPSDPWPLLGNIRCEQTLVWNAETDHALDRQTIAELAGLQTTNGAVPSKVGVQLWSPPWSPLFLDWAIAFSPAAKHQTDALADWTLPAGPQPDPTDDFTWTWTGPKPSTGDPVTIMGRTFLTPQATVLLAGRIEQLIERYGATATAQRDLWAFQDALAYLQHADLLSQALGGFNLQLLQRTPVQFRTPSDGSLDPFLDPPGLPPFVPDSTPFPGAAPRLFNAIRSGHAQLTKLWVVDGFGQVFDVFAALNEPVSTYAPLVGRDLATPQDPRLVALKPRITQSSRLSLTWLDADDDGAEVDVDAAADPVCGWLILDELDESLLVYDRSGSLQGELLLTETGPRWLPPPDAGPPPHGSGPVEVTIANPHLKGVVHGIVGLPDAAGKVALTGLLDLVNQAGWTIDPGGGWADEELPALVGRPLAVVRARLRFELQGAVPATAQAWSDTGLGETYGFDQVPFPVQVGAVELHDDGVVGYYLNDDYTQIQSVYTLVHPSPYVGSLRPELRFARHSAAFVTLLLDPTTTVHALSGVLPPLSVTLPGRFATPALSSMEIMFRTGPVIGDPGPAAMPLPAIRQGSWSWLQYTSTTAAAQAGPIDTASPVATLASAPPVVREGWLKLILGGPSTQLTYAVQPSPVACGTEHTPSTVTLVVTAYNGTGGPVALESIALTVPAGADADDLTHEPALISPSVPAGSTWKIATDGKGHVVATAPAAQPAVAAGTTLQFLIAGVRVNNKGGTAQIAVVETGAHATGDTTLAVAKTPPLANPTDAARAAERTFR